MPACGCVLPSHPSCSSTVRWGSPPHCTDGKTEVYEGRVVSGLHPSGWYSQAHNGLSFCCTSCLRVKAWAGAKGAAADLGGGDFMPQRRGGGNALRGPAGTRSEGWGEPSMRGDGGGGGSEGRSGANGSTAAQKGPPPPPAAGVGGGGGRGRKGGAWAQGEVEQLLPTSQTSSCGCLA